MNVAPSVVAMLAVASVGCMMPAAAQRLPLDVTLEVVDDISTLDAVVMELRSIDPDGADSSDPPRRSQSGNADDVAQGQRDQPPPSGDPQSAPAEPEHGQHAPDR